MCLRVKLQYKAWSVCLTTSRTLLRSAPRSILRSTSLRVTCNIKRHRQVLCDNIQDITKTVIRRLARPVCSSMCHHKITPPSTDQHTPGTSVSSNFPDNKYYSCTCDVDDSGNSCRTQCDWCFDKWIYECFVKKE
jgi:hypothetical protein